MKRPILLNSEKRLLAGPVIRAIQDVAHARGADQHKLLRGTGIFAAEQPVSMLQLTRLMANAQAQAAGHDCAFQAGRSLATSHMSPFIYGLRYCRHFGDVLRVLGVFQMLLCPLLSVRRYEDTKQVYLVLQNTSGSQKQWPFIVELYCSLLVALSKQWCGHRLPFYFEFPQARPRHIQEYEEHLGYRVGFGRPLGMIYFTKDILRVPFLYHDSVARSHYLLQLYEHQLAARPLVDEIRQRHHLANPPLTDVAHQLNLSPASLKRKLREHNTSFQALADEVKRQQAVFLLSVQKLNNQQSAMQMAFTDLANFRRAVKRWTGLTPSQLRGQSPA